MNPNRKDAQGAVTVAQVTVVVVMEVLEHLVPEVLDLLVPEVVDDNSYHHSYTKITLKVRT